MILQIHDGGKEWCKLNLRRFSSSLLKCFEDKFFTTSLCVNRFVEFLENSLKNEKKCLKDADYKFIYPPRSAHAKIYGTSKYP